MLITNLDILPHLSGLNVAAELVLVRNDLNFDLAHLFHQVLVELILVHFAALFRK